MKKRYKIKKDVYLYLAVIVVIIIGIYKGITEYKTYKYHQTTEYKLLNKGYTTKDLKILNKYYKEKDLKKLLKEHKNIKLMSLMSEEKYKHKNLDEYLKWYDINASKTAEEIISEVNIYHNYNYYEKVISSDTSKNNLIIVNKYYQLDQNYVPENLVTISTNYSWGNLGSQKITSEAYEAFKNMWEDAKLENIHLMVNSSYRSYQSQEQVYNNYKKNHGEDYADKIAARPGFSEHQTGLCFDLNSVSSEFEYTDGVSSSELKAKIAEKTGKKS